MKTYKDIIEDTLKYYTTHNRGLSDTGCVYINENGDMCAVGRYAKNPKELDDTNSGDIYGVMDSLIGEMHNNDSYFDLDRFDHCYNLVLSHYILKDEVAHLNDINFWNQLQTFHDFDSNWKGKELTDEGKIKYNRLLKEWSSVS